MLKAKAKYQGHNFSQSQNKSQRARNRTFFASFGRSPKLFFLFLSNQKIGLSSSLEQDRFEDLFDSFDAETKYLSFKIKGLKMCPRRRPRDQGSP